MSEFWQCLENGPALIHESEVIEKYNLFFRRFVYTDSIGIEHSYDTEVFKTKEEAWKNIIISAKAHLEDHIKDYNKLVSIAIADGYKI